MEMKEYNLYLESKRKYKQMAKERVIDNNPIIALNKIVTDRAGDEEKQRITLRFVNGDAVLYRSFLKYH